MAQEGVACEGPEVCESCGGGVAAVSHHTQHRERAPSAVAVNGAICDLRDARGHIRPAAARMWWKGKKGTGHGEQEPLSSCSTRTDIGGPPARSSRAITRADGCVKVTVDNVMRPSTCQWEQREGGLKIARAAAESMCRGPINCHFRHASPTSRAHSADAVLCSPPHRVGRRRRGCQFQDKSSSGSPCRPAFARL